MTRTRLPERNLDVLRAIAVLCVVTDHVLWARGLKPPLVTDWELGRVGVLLFFVHTSLVLMSSMERGGQKRHWVRAFYTRRAFRIYPLAVAAVIVTLLLRIPPNVPATFIPPDSRTILTNLLLVQNVSGNTNVMGMLWTLPIEVQMYVVLPALFLLARRSIAGVVGALGAAAVLALVVQYAPVPALWRLSFALFGPCFVSGVLAFAILRKAPGFKLPPWMWIPFLVAAVPLFVVFGPSPTRLESGWLFCLAVGLAIPFVTELEQSLFTRVAKTICTYSYGVYLMVTPANWIAFVVLRDQPSMIQWLALAVAIVALPWAAYTFIEHPAIELGRNLAGSRHTLAEPAPAP